MENYFLFEGKEYVVSSDMALYSCKKENSRTDILGFFFDKNTINYAEKSDSRKFQYDTTGLFSSLPMSNNISKMGKNILGFATLAGFTCPNCKSCFGKCYGRRGNFMNASVHNKLALNTAELLVNPDSLFEKMVYQIKNTKNLDSVRMDVVGDIVSIRHKILWEKLAKEFPLLPFWGFTKDNFAPEGKNINVVHSILPDGEVNFGTKEYIFEMYRKYKNQIKIGICPNNFIVIDKNTGKKKKTKVHCNDCHRCARFPYMLFKIH